MLKDNIILFYKIKYDILVNNNFSKEEINYNKSIFKLGKVEDNKFYEWISYNKFRKTPEKLPELEQIAIPLKLVNTYLCGNNKKITDEVESIKNNTHELFTIYSNDYLKVGEYLILVNNKKILIFTKDNIKTFENNIIDYYFFNTLYYLQFNNKIKTIYPKQIFIVNSINFGNIMLVHISTNKYLYLHNNICYEFISYNLITKFDILISKTNYPYILYAIDKLNNYYIFQSLDFFHNIIVMTKNNINLSPKKLNKLYTLKRKIFCKDSPFIKNKPFIKNFQQIDKIYKSYSDNKTSHEISLFLDFVEFHLEPQLSILKLDGTKEILDKYKYMKLIKDYGDTVGIYQLKYKIPSWLLKTMRVMTKEDF